MWWGSPWLSFNVNNPSADNLLITSAVVHVLSVQHINDLILHVPDIEGVATGKAVLKIRNAGWGMGKDGTLTLKLAKPDASREAYHVFKQFIVQSLSVDKEEVEIEIAHYLPPKTDWYTYTGNIDQGVLYLFGVYEYTQQDGRKMTETFHTTIYQTGSGGGNISETAGFNVRLPEAPTTEPIFISLANCMAPKSAAKFVFNFTAARSATYRLKLTLLTTLKTVLEEEVDVDVLVNRDQSPSPRRRSTSFIIDERVGCT